MVTGMQVAQYAKEQLSQLTGLPANTVSSLAKAENGWRVSVDMVELHRIPDSTDVLATYDVQLDEEGNVLSYERRRRYLRCETTEEE